MNDTLCITFVHENQYVRVPLYLGTATDMLQTEQVSQLCRVQDPRSHKQAYHRHSQQLRIEILISAKPLLDCAGQCYCLSGIRESRG